MPTGNIVSDKWFVRVTLPHQAITALMNANKVSFMDHTRWLIVSHVGERTEKEHVHMLVELAQPLQKQTVDKRYKRVFGVSGADYSSKPWDGDMGAGAGSYLFHDPAAAVLYKVGFTDDDIANFERLNNDIQKVVAVNKQRASGRCVDRLLASIANSDREWTRQEIARQLLTDIRDGTMYEPGDYVLRRYIEEIYGKQFKGARWDEYVVLRVENLVRSEDVQVYHPL